MKRKPWVVLSLLVGVTSAGFIHESSPIAGLALARPIAPYATRMKLSEPRMFAPGVISTQDDEFGGTFSPDGKEFYFTKRTPGTIVSSMVTICVSRYENGRWNRPSIASFSGQYLDFSPCFSPDGSKLFFSSVRPVDGKDRQDTDIWFVERSIGGRWSEPHNLGAPINTPGPDQNASIAADGTIYFASVRADGKGSLDLYRSRLIAGQYGEPENLGGAINTETTETHPYISPDQSYLLFSSIERPDSPVGPGSPYPRTDLYLSLNDNGKWTAARRLPAPINTDATESCPFVSPDGQYLFFTSERNFTTIPMQRKLRYSQLQALLRKPGNGLGDIYQVDISVLGIPTSRGNKR